MMLRGLALSGLASALALLTAGPGRAESLSDVVAYAYDVNPGIQAQRASMRALDESYVQARASFGLNISANAGDMSYELRRSGPGGGRADAVTDTVGISATQPIYS